MLWAILLYTIIIFMPQKLAELGEKNSFCNQPFYCPLGCKCGRVLGVLWLDQGEVQIPYGIRIGDSVLGGGVCRDGFC